MHKFQFTPDDLFINRLKTYPEYNVFIYQGQMFVNSESRISGSGGLVVYDINRNLTGSNQIYPSVEVDENRSGFKKYIYQPMIKSYSGEHYNIRRNWLINAGIKTEEPGAFATNGIMTSSYGFESPIKRNFVEGATPVYNGNYWNYSSGQYYTNELRTWNDTQNNLIPNSLNVSSSALQNVARKYTHLSHHFLFTPLNEEEETFFQSSDLNGRDLVYDTNAINFITIPSMYYGSTIKKGSVELNYYITGSKIATCADIHHNGTLIETSGTLTGSVVGLVMYDEGIIMLTASHELESNNIEYSPSSPTIGSWVTYGTTLNDGTGSSNTLASASYDLNFKGTSYVNTMTMFAHARKGHLNHSNNPTYRTDTLLSSVLTGSGKHFIEGTYGINNIVSASYTSASFDKTTYISKVHIYDEDGNLIAITSLAKPIKKTLEDEYTFKMKLDL